MHPQLPWEAHGIEVTSFKTLHDLQSLPMVDKQTLRAAARMLTQCRILIARANLA